MRRPLIAIMALLMAGVISLGGSGSAGAHAEPHPAHIHAGTCAELGDVVVPLSDVSTDFIADGTPMAMDAMGAATGNPAHVSITTVPLGLADIVAAQHSINVHLSAEEIGTYVACGEIGGPTIGASNLAITLAEQNDSGVSGVAWLADNGDSTTTVYVFLIVADEMGDMDHDMGTPDA